MYVKHTYMYVHTSYVNHMRTQIVILQYWYFPYFFLVRSGSWVEERGERESRRLYKDYNVVSFMADLGAPDLISEVADSS